MTTTHYKPITPTEFLKLPETKPASEFIQRSLARTEVFGTGANG